ncbi:MAG: hypothetical protein ABIH72_00610 [archaeon]
MGNITLKGFICERCTHKWIPRNLQEPRVCPKCKSPYWNVPRKKKKKMQKKGGLK